MRPRIIDYLNDVGLGWAGGFVPAPGVVYAIMIIVLALAFLQRCRRVKLPLERALEVAFYSALGAMIGTRLFFLIVTGAIARTGVLEWIGPNQGTASWGAYLGAMVGLGLYCWVTKLRPWSYLDVGFSIAGLGIFIGRWSCFLAGDDFGRITSRFWAIRFPPESYAYAAHLARGDIEPSAALSLPVHPLQLILSANGLILFLITTAVWSRTRHLPGRTFAVFWLLYGATRFQWEFLRDPAAGGAPAFLSTSQWMCLALFVGAALLLFLRRRVRPAGNAALDRVAGSPS